MTRIVGIYLLLLLGLCTPGKQYAQERMLLTELSFIEQVKSFHPLAIEAGLATQKAAADLLAARGNFDPQLDYGNMNKTLDGTTYYRYRQAELKLPTATGVTVKAGFENSSGQYINPELTQGVASYLGVEVPLLNGLLLDKKRAALQQARLFREQSEADRQAMLNDLFLKAYSAYWDWAGAYEVYRIYNYFLDVSSQRMRLVKISFQNGERSMGDTVEAFAQWQSFHLLQLEALQQYNIKSLELSNYLWTKEGSPYLLPPGWLPDTVALLQSVFVADSALATQRLEEHPLLQSARFKLERLGVEKKYKFQQLLPTVLLKANVLSKEYFTYKGLDAAYFNNNYKWGIQFNFPLLLRQARGEYRATRIKIQEADLALQQKRWELSNKIRQYTTELGLLQEQLLSTSSMQQSYRSLLRLEDLKFSQGESSLFLVNSRENKLLEAQKKLIDLRIKYLKTVAYWKWSAGWME